jgi:hypothetical protein
MKTPRARALRFLLFVVVPAALLVSGCGDDTSADADGQSPQPGTETTAAGAEPAAEFADLPHACDVVPPEEVELIIGHADQEALADRALDGAHYTQCIWDEPNSSSLIAVSIVDTAARFELHQRVLPDFEVVEGLGDEALVAPGVSSETRGATGGYTVSIRRGATTVVVALRYEGVTPADHAIDLARSVVDRLG